MQVLTEASWAALEPLVEERRPKGKVAAREMRRTIEAIIWRCRNGAKWRALPEELGPRWRAAQLFIRWSKAGVWERLLEKTQEKGRRLPPEAGTFGNGIVHPDGTVVRAHAKAAGAPNPQKRDLEEAEAERVRRLTDLAAAMGQRHPSSATAPAAPSPLPSSPARRTS